jgi:hypothetical protein
MSSSHFTIKNFPDSSPLLLQIWQGILSPMFGTVNVPNLDIVKRIIMIYSPGKINIRDKCEPSKYEWITVPGMKMSGGNCFVASEMNVKFTTTTRRLLKTQKGRRSVSAVFFVFSQSQFLQRHKKKDDKKKSRLSKSN